MIYFDSGATTLQKPPAVAEAFRYAMAHFASPGRGGHAPAMAAADAVYACREKAAALFDAQPEQIVFTMNATHALNIAIRTLVRPGDRVVISGFEHNAVTRPLHYLGAKTAVAGTRLFDPADTLEAFSRLLTPETKAAVCTHVSNVFGYILPIEQIAALCRARGVPLIVDASQSAGILPVSLRGLGAAFIAMPGHKGLYGPQGTGMLVCGRMPEPLMQGGSGSQSALAEMPDFLPDRLEAGTMNLPGIAGLHAALGFLADTGLDAIRAHELALTARFLTGLAPLCAAERVKLLGLPGIEGRAGVVSIQTPGRDLADIAFALDDRFGIQTRVGLHCAPAAHQTLGSFPTGSIRFSFGFFNTEADVDAALAALDILTKEAHHGL